MRYVVGVSLEAGLEAGLEASGIKASEARFCQTSLQFCSRPGLEAGLEAEETGGAEVVARDAGLEDGIEARGVEASAGDDAAGRRNGPDLVRTGLVGDALGRAVARGARPATPPPGPPQAVRKNLFPVCMRAKLYI